MEFSVEKTGIDVKGRDERRAAKVYESAIGGDDEEGSHPETLRFSSFGF